MANLYVVEIHGMGRSLGDIDAEYGMVTDLGIVRWISGNLIYVVSGKQDGWVYNTDVQVASGHAGNLFAWPTGSNCQLYSRRALFPNGFRSNEASMTGHSYSNGNTVSSYGRAG
jgi:hypothetical protein